MQIKINFVKACICGVLLAAISFPCFAGTWKLYKGTSELDTVLSKNFVELNHENLPSDYRGRFWLKYEIDSSEIEKIEELAVYLGRFRDADATFWNGKEIGRTGLRKDSSSFLPHKSRVYYIDDVKPGKNILLVNGEKKHASVLRIGPTEKLRPIFGEYSSLKKKTFIKDIIRTWFPLIFGFFLILTGLYHIYLYTILKTKKAYLSFGQLLISYGIFSVCFSYWLYEYFENTDLIFGIHVIASFWALYFFTKWYLQDYKKKFWKLYKDFILIVSLVGTILTAISYSFEKSLYYYLNWFSILLLSLVVFFVHECMQIKEKGIRAIPTFLAFSIFFASTVSDALVSNEIIQGEHHFSTIAFIVVLCSTIFFLGKDFAFAYLDVEQTVRERTDELEKAIDHVKMVEDQKKRVFTNISHDLKTPIAVAIHKLDELSEYVLKEKGREVLIKSNNALLRLNSMVKNILDTISSESGTIKLIWNKDNAVKFIKDWKIDFEEVGKLKNKTVHFSSNQDEINIPWDRDKMNRVFDNFMSNALKYCPENGDIYIRLLASGTRFQLEVEDTGEGLPEEEWKSVFKRFYQGSSTNLRDHGGFGIGLSFVYEVINKMNGNVFITHGDVGKIKFVVELPINQDIDLIESEAEQEISELRPHTLKAIAVAEYPRKYPEKENPDLPRLLVAEDNPDIAENLLYILQKDYNVYFAENGLEAIGVLEKISIDCILSDLMMPKMDGSELLSRVREDYRWKLIPFIMVTSKSDRENIIEHLNSGAQDYITKPFEKDILKARVLSQSQTSIIRKHMLNSDKLAALGVLAAGIAHEIKNPIHASKNFSTGIQKRVRMMFGAMENRDPEFEKKMEYYMERLNDNLYKIDEISRAIGSYTNGNKDKVDININEMIDSSIILFGTKLKEKSLTIEKQYTKDNVHILGFSPLNQCVVNLIDNAIAVAKDKIVIETERTEQRVCIRVKDDGEGIPPELQNKIFDMFMTTKPPGEGTGLGLSIVKNIVELQHGGSIEILSSTPNGTTFEIKVPLEAPDPEESGVNVFHGEGETHAY